MTRLVQLRDGRMVSRDSEEWRHECEARHIARLPELDQRREWLAEIEHRRGATAAKRLRATIADLWKARA